MSIVGVGTEIVECLRIAQMIEHHGERFVDRVYTPFEVSFCRARNQSTQYFAGYWAVKEAILKATGMSPGRGIGWRDIEIRTENRSRLGVAFRGGVRDYLEASDIGEVLISVSHCRTHATGYAIALGRS